MRSDICSAIWTYSPVDSIARGNAQTAWTLEDLERENILVQERTSLKDVSLDMKHLITFRGTGISAYLVNGGTLHRESAWLDTQIRRRRLCLL